MSTILVTGGSGFVASHIILQLLKAGHRVRATVRDPKRESDVRNRIKIGGLDPGASLSFHAADLEKDEGWANAVAGCEYVHHVASPFPARDPKHDDELIVPAREGTLRVLRASRDAGVRRVVMTSSFAAIGYGHKPQAAPFDESSWTDIHAPNVPAYHKSKTLAEKAAWEFISKDGGELELSVINPVGIFGPVLGADLSSSIRIVQSLMNGDLPGSPAIYFGVVDVRDVADLHLRAMIQPAARGERFIAVAGPCMSIPEMASLLKNRMKDSSLRVPTRTLPSWLLKALAIVVPSARQVRPELDKIRNSTNEKARRLLGWSPRPNEECILATAESLVQLGLLKEAKS